MDSRQLAAVARVLVGAVLALALVLLPARVAVAACHAFQVKADPVNLTEGGAVNVTVSRDAAVNPSSIDVATVDETARAPDDYTAVSRTISFTSETSQTFTVETKNDTSSESSETFRLHLSKPSGCTVNSNFVVGPDAQVTLQDDDAASTTAPRSSTSSSPRSSAPPSTANASATTAPTTTAGEEAAAPTGTDSVPSSSTSTSTAIEAAAVATDEDGGPGLGVALAIAAVVVAAGAAAFWALGRRQSGRPV